MADAQPTPVMRQYLRFKKKHEDAILLFRMGDFYEVFYDDAKLCARVLGLALTSRDKGANAVPMAGFPHHAADTYIKRLVQSGHRVAVCEQVQDPKDAKGLVDRDVIRVITAGTLTEEHILQEKTNNFLAAVCAGDSRMGLAWVDLSTGKFEVEEAPPRAVPDSLNRIAPAECLLPEGDEPDGAGGSDVLAWLPEGCMVTRRPAWEFSQEEGRRRLNAHFQTATLDGFGCEGLGPAIGAAGALMSYLEDTQKSAVDHITRMEPFVGGQYLVLDSTTQHSLELVQVMRGGEKYGSLLWVLDRTQTPMGGRLLRRWILTPLRDVAQIEKRLDAVEEFFAGKLLRDGIRETLRSVYDIERLTAKICCARANARDLLVLRSSLARIPSLKEKLKERESELVGEVESALDPLPEVEGLVASAVNPDPPLTLTEGGIIRDGYSPQLDELRRTASEGKGWIARFEKEEAARSGIPSLKVGFNRVFGYYIEVTNTHRDKVPEHYIRKQTLKNAERYITPELKEWESTVLSAGERAKELEYEIFQQMRQEISTYVRRLQSTAEALATLDVVVALAVVAAESDYVRPRVTEDLRLYIDEGRHPVLEQIMEEEFVPNSVEMDGDRQRLLVITGPNMAGKSVYIRQVALIVLMAQMGSFVPAREAVIGVADRIFTRVGASDEQRAGKSTFMVEMIEVANILNNATDRSLIILDEVGRGTSTYDGVSIAWAASEYIHNRCRARTLFATHYHEISQLAATLEGVKNYNVAVREWQNEVIFLHRVVPGATDRSYGIHVARLAGVPHEVVERSSAILSRLERDAVRVNDEPRFAPAQQAQQAGPRLVQRPLFLPLDSEIRDELLALDVEKLSPLEALRKLDEIRRRLKEDEE